MSLKHSCILYWNKAVLSNECKAYCVLAKGNNGFPINGIEPMRLAIIRYYKCEASTTRQCHHLRKILFISSIQFRKFRHNFQKQIILLNLQIKYSRTFFWLTNNFVKMKSRLLLQRHTAPAVTLVKCLVKLRSLVSNQTKTVKWIL